MDVHNSIEKVKVCFSIVFYNEDYILQDRRKENCVITNFMTISEDK